MPSRASWPKPTALPPPLRICFRRSAENLEWDWGALWSSRRERLPRSVAIAFGMRRISRPQNSTRSAEKRTSRFQRRPARSCLAKRITNLDGRCDDRTRILARLRRRREAGLHGGVIFPILLDTEALGVVEFFSRAVRERDEEQLATLSAIGSQIGQFIKRRRAEAALRASEERWRRLFETSAAGMALVRLDGVFTAANPALQRMLGRSEDEIVGRNVLELNHEDERAATAEALCEISGAAC